MISTTGKLYYTPEELEKAKEHANALEYAIDKYHLVKRGNSWTMKEHDSMVFLENGKWYWNSQDKSGNALDFITQYEGRSFTEAVLLLAGTYYSPAPERSVPQTRQQEKRELEIPPQAADNQKVIQYLTEERGIDRSVVTACIRNGSVYQSAVPAKFGVINNLVMVGFDAEHTPRYVASRSISGRKFRMDATGSDKSYPFVIQGAPDSKGVVLVESPIEAMSYHCLAHKYNNPYAGYTIVASGGATSRAAIDRYLYDHPDITHIVNGLNNDDTVSDKLIAAITDYSLHAGESFRKQWTPAVIAGVRSKVDMAAMQLRYSGSDEWKQPLLRFLAKDSQTWLDNSHATAMLEVIAPIVQSWPQGTIEHQENAGQAGTRKLEELFGSKYRITRHKPHLNDWNDVLRDNNTRKPPQTREMIPKKAHNQPTR